MKKLVAGVVASLSALSLTIAYPVVVSANTSNVTPQSISVSSEVIVAQGTLQDLFQSSTLTQSEKDQIVSSLLQLIPPQERTSFRIGTRSVFTSSFGISSVASTNAGRYFTSSQKFTHAQVVKIAKAGGNLTSVTSILASILGVHSLQAGFGMSLLSAIYSDYYGNFQTAAANGWGIKITLTIDSYVPTSAGMSWSISYIK
jgi:hypothetical protein